MGTVRDSDLLAVIFLYTEEQTRKLNQKCCPEKEFTFDYRTRLCLIMLQFLNKGRVSTKYSVRIDKAEMEK